MELVKIVVRYADYRVIKGYTRDFFPNKPSFHLELISGTNKGKIVDIQLKDLKAVFFVKDFIGKAYFNEKKCFETGQTINGRKVKVSFKDGEVLVGSTVGYDLKRQGFFLHPADPQSNNLKVFVILPATSKVEFL